MDAKIEELVMKANINKSYQVLLISIGLLIYITTNIISATYGLFTIEPLVNYTSNGKNYSNIQLNQSICDEDPNYIISKNYTSTWYYSFKGYCNKDVNFLNPLIGNFGSMMGFLAVPFEIRYLGERNTILVTGYGYSIVCLINIFMPNWPSAFVFDFLNNFTGTAMEIAFFMSLSENCPGKLRAIGLNIISSGYSISGLIFTALFDALNDWKVPFIISTVSNLILTISIHIFMYESPRYYLKIGQVDMFVKTLKKIAKFNKCEKEFDPLANRILNEYEEEHALTESCLKIEEANKSLLEKFKEFTSNEEINKKKYTVLDLIRFKSHRYKFILMCLLGIIVSGGYQSMQITQNSAGANPFTISMITYSIQMIVATSTGFLMNLRFLKRKGNFYSGIIILVVLMLILMLVDLSEISRIALLIAIINICYFINQVYLAYNTEVYSTKLLNVGLTWNAVFAISGSMTFPILITYLDKYIYLMIYIILYLIAGVCVFFLPETYGKPQPTEILEEKLIEDKTNTEKI